MDQRRAVQGIEGIALAPMDPAIFLLIYAAIAIASAVLWHRYVPSYAGAWVASVATTVALALFIDRLQSGHWARNTEIALLLTAVPAAVVSLLVGLVFRAIRKGKQEVGR